MSKKMTIAQPRVLLEEPHNCCDIKDIQNVLCAFFDPLVAYDDDMNFVPGLATAWTISDDARTWTFSLRHGVTFHNGASLDADAVVYSLERMARPDMGVTLGAPGVYNQYLGDMNIRALGPGTVQIRLASPMADLLDVLVTGYILPPDIVAATGAQFKARPVGTGPYRFTEFRENEFVRAVKNHDYFGPQPWPDSIEWRAVADPDRRIQMVREGAVDIAVGPPYTVDVSAPVARISTRGTTTYILIFNAGDEVMSDPRIRRALNLGIDRAALIEHVLNNAGFPLHGFISPAHYGYDDRCPGFSHAPAEARKLLAEAGYPDRLKLTLDSPTSMPDEAVHLSEALAEQLLKIGVELEIVFTEDRERYANKVRCKEIHHMCVFDSSPLSTYRVLKEKIDSRFQGSWWQGYANPALESLLDKAQSTADPAQREALYRQCYRILNEDPPWLYLYNYRHITCMNPALSGWIPPVHGVFDPRYL